ncbi:MAG: glycosyl transferase, partial [Gammaproteobacteria bacterium]|nr:glycosyl transferase [Gammaproteobacteria bacterium]
MKILFIHQNFPGQFKFLGPALVKEGHKVFALAIRDKTVKWKGIDVISYQPARATSKEIHPWISDFETKVIRAEAVYRKLLELKEKGLNPDLIVAHPGWGESLLVKNIWPSVKLGISCEFHYAASVLD